MDHTMVSLADQVYDRLEKGVLTGEFQRDEILTETRLSEELEVSRTPIREALRRLSHEHLVEIGAKGARVIGIQREDIEDIYEIRIRIEGVAAARCAKAISEQQLAELKETLDLQEFYTEKVNPEGIKDMDSKFHRIIYECCGSNILRDTLEPLHRRILKFRRVSVSVPSRARHSLEEHRAIYEAIASRDAERAEKLMEEHIRHAEDGILESIDKSST
ncbi:MAG: GntR family transcriptional regulator [Clostridia bacterium]|nr:GntR family transcriptional regulator [Clostridia bacterium]